MVLIVNGELIQEKMVQDEIQRLQPHFQSVFSEQSGAEQEKQLAEWARENVIESVLLRQSAHADSHSINPETLDQAFLKLKEERGGEEKFYKETGLTHQDDENILLEIEQQHKVEHLMSELHAKANQVSETDAKAFYQSNPEQFMLPEMVHAGHIVKHIEGYRTEKEAQTEIQEIWEKIQSGTTYEELAEQQTDCADNSGDLGVFPRGQMVQEFEDVVFKMEAGEVSQVFPSPFGFHIAKVFEKKEPRKIEFDEVKSQIIEKLTEDAQNVEVEKYVDGVKETARINYFPDEIKFKKGLSSVLVKPSGPDCNLDCDYCFYLEKADLFTETKKHRMSLETLDIFIRQTLQQTAGHVSFGWQGGEPTLMGLPFFQQAVKLQKRYGSGRSVGNGLQTNGLLLDEDWANFLKENNFLVGISIDGPEHIHDKYRTHVNGKPSWQQVVDNTRMLMDAGVEVNVLSVVNEYSVKFPEEIYQFHKSLGFEYMQFIPLVETDPDNPEKSAAYSVGEKAYGDFLIKLFDLWQNDFEDGIATTSIRHFDSVFHSYVGLEAPECTLLKECGNYVVVEHNGDVYSCDFFVEPTWKLGNLYDDDILVMLNSEKQKEFGELKSDLPEKCQKCKWQRQCYGGCTKDRLRDPEDNGLSHFCESYIAFFEHSDVRLKELAEDWKAKQSQLHLQEPTKAQPVKID
ncbi:MAG: anaerobic sulfatase maturase [Candidatus Marinimicrobia bacterium]|jgi:uncharacterized protein|nr:anaerobic sulfatase maturase [Candidatus Neomarinimicrobiota bacterium]MBT3823578.1 anaerobic sulfatase maturase [Candidatus Neomarinimicrobiota bacterium]MBT4129563.1 anaerobic sulfatase maturase [Candidatus Neomarinimicrobiota bacterium]MBT4295911.1 anaerobic sulfatase maturase [Candidatus Neomarinimicrobiota bacterium]MBT4420087.1 anaerobic sulfatase maturase [Candidatus Neomarinimicrobiota bacterium]